MINQQYFYTTEGIEPERIIIFNGKKVSLMRGKKISPVPTLEELESTIDKFAELQEKFNKLKNHASNSSVHLKKWIEKNIDND